MGERLTSQEIREKKYPSFLRLPARIAEIGRDAEPYVTEQEHALPLSDPQRSWSLTLPGVLTVSGLIEKAEAAERAEQILQSKGE